MEWTKSIIALRSIDEQCFYTSQYYTDEWAPLMIELYTGIVEHHINVSVLLELEKLIDHLLISIRKEVQYHIDILKAHFSTVTQSILVTE